MAERKERSRKVSLKKIEAQIEQAKERGIKTQNAADAAKKELKALMDQRDVLQQDIIIKLLANSKRSYQKVMDFLKSDTSSQG
ncbi:MAG: hypothetical protein ACTTK0_00530 [Stomatobaculum sp.]